MLATISIDQLAIVHGGQAAQQQQPPPPKIDKEDVIEVTGKAIQTVVAPITMVGNAGQAYRQYNDPAIKDAGWGIKLLNGGLGLVGINPLAPKK